MFPLYTFIGGEIILKIFIKVMEAGIAFSLMISLMLAYYITKEIIITYFLYLLSLVV